MSEQTDPNAASAPKPVPATPAPAAKDTVTVTVPDAEGEISVGGIYYQAAAGSVEVPKAEVDDFLRRVPGAVRTGG